MGGANLKVIQKQYFTKNFAKKTFSAMFFKNLRPYAEKRKRIEF